jgi:hypothetical protein
MRDPNGRLADLPLALGGELVRIFEQVRQAVNPSLGRVFVASKPNLNLLR